MSDQWLYQQTFTDVKMKCSLIAWIFWCPWNYGLIAPDIPLSECQRRTPLSTTDQTITRLWVTSPGFNRSAEGHTDPINSHNRLEIIPHLHRCTKTNPSMNTHTRLSQLQISHQWKWMRRRFPHHYIHSLPPPWWGKDLLTVGGVGGVDLWKVMLQ